MDVLIVERDELLGTVLADALAEDGMSAAVMPDEEALALPPDQAALVVITGRHEPRPQRGSGRHETRPVHAQEMADALHRLSRIFMAGPPGPECSDGWRPVSRKAGCPDADGPYGATIDDLRHVPPAGVN
jgi:hypothetical protein